MSIFHFNDDAKKSKCLRNPQEACVGEECHAWMYRVHKDSEGKKSTDIAKGVCGWLYQFAYFRDRNENPNL